MFSYIKNHFHPLWHLRQMAWFRSLQAAVDFPIYKKVGKIHVAAFWLRDLSYLLAPNDTEQQTTRCFLALLAGLQPTCFLDIGANIGSYSWITLNQTEQPEIWMFEPDEKNVRLLRRTIMRNALEHRVTLHAAAVSDENGTIDFFVDDVSGATGSIANHTSNTSSLHYVYGMGATRSVPCVTLDSFWEKLAGQRVLIKIDVDGAEDRLLRGGQRMLREVRPVIIMECYDLQKIVWIKEFDYEIRDLEGPNYLLFPTEMKTKVENTWKT